MRIPLLVLCATLGGCAAPPAARQGPGWHHVSLPGKVATRYAWADKDGRRAIAARADRSASLWRRHLAPGAALPREVRFSWWVQDLVPGASVADAAREDAPARVVFAFHGDPAQLSARNRLLFDLAETLSGERPPYATLMYVFDHDGAEERVVINPRTDRVRKIVLDAGPRHLRQWRQHRRDLAADFRRAYGEEPGPLLSVALMTDADNTQQQAQAWYGPIELLP